DQAIHFVQDEIGGFLNGNSATGGHVAEYESPQGIMSPFHCSGGSFCRGRFFPRCVSSPFGFVVLVRCFGSLFWFVVLGSSFRFAVPSPCYLLPGWALYNPPVPEFSISQMAPSGATAISRTWNPSFHRSAGVAPPLPSSTTRLNDLVTSPPINS